MKRAQTEAHEHHPEREGKEDKKIMSDNRRAERVRKPTSNRQGRWSWYRK